MKILVTGANGQVGSEIKFLSENYRYEFAFIDLEDLDLTKSDEIKPYLSGVDADFIINCAAYTAVDKAEDEPELAEKINAGAPKEIAHYCKENNKRLIHISTDYVFDGDFNRPINENDSPCPKSVYGKTKLDGENHVLETLPNAYIIRTSWVYSTFGKNFVKTMLKLGVEKDELNVVNDQIGTPTYARDLAKAILTIVDNLHNNDQPGIYHFSNEGVCSWYDFASEIMQLAGLGCRVSPIPTSAFPTKAKRPAFSVLDKSKIKSQFAIKVEHWRNSLQTVVPLMTRL